MITNPYINPAVPPGDLPSGAIAESFPRWVQTASLTITSGRLTMGLIYLPSCTVTSITFAGSGVLSGGSHGWAALYRDTYALLGQSTNDTGITWAANALKTFTLASPITVSAGTYYVGLMVVASGMPTVHGVTPGLAQNLVVPVKGWSSTTGLTTTAPDPAGSPGGTSAYLYAYVS